MPPAGAPAALLAAVLLAGAAVASAAPPPLVLSCERDGTELLVAASLPAGPASGAERQATLDALARGLRAEVVFSLRIYAPSRGPAAFLGDRLLVASTISRSARWDPFAERYLLHENVDGEERDLVGSAEAQELLERFFAVERLLLLPPAEAGQDGLYLHGRYRLSPVQLDGMLRLVSLFTDLGSRTSRWSRVELGGPP